MVRGRNTAIAAGSQRTRAACEVSPETRDGASWSLCGRQDRQQ